MPQKTATTKRRRAGIMFRDEPIWECLDEKREAIIVRGNLLSCNNRYRALCLLLGGDSHPCTDYDKDEYSEILKKLLHTEQNFRTFNEAEGICLSLFSDAVFCWDEETNPIGIISYKLAKNKRYSIIFEISGVIEHVDQGYEVIGARHAFLRLMKGR